MDIKTLKDLSIRVLQGERIVTRIGKLKENIDLINHIHSVCFMDQDDIVFDASIGNITEQMKIAYVQAAKEEVVLLEQDLAAL